MSSDQVIREENTEMSFKDYYQAKKQIHIEFRDSICLLLDISIETFYRKLRRDSWKPLEKREISNFIGRDIYVLFPLDQDFTIKD